MPKAKYEQRIVSPRTTLTTKYGLVATDKVTDLDYEEALRIGLNELISKGKINYKDVKA